MAYDLNKVTLGSNGMVQTGPGSFVNSQNLSPAGYAAAVNYNLNKDKPTASVTFDRGTGTTSVNNTPYVAPTSTAYASDSSSIITGENNTISSLKSLMGNTPNFQNIITNYGNSTDLLANYYSMLEARRQKQVAEINKQFDIVEGDTKTAQTKETGSTNAALTRLGGYLGGSGSGQGVMQNLAVTHRGELEKLAVKRAAAVQAANDAIDDKQFEFAKLKVQEAKEAEKEIYNRQQDFFNNALKLQSEFRAQQDQRAQTSKDLLDKWQYFDDPAKINSSDKSYVDSYYGSGFTDNYLKTMQGVKAANARKDNIAAVQAYINLLKSVPAGTPIPIGDEIVTGIGDSGDITTYKVDGRSTGTSRILSFNKMNNTFTLSPEFKDTSNSGGSTAENEAALSAFTMMIHQAKGDDGKPLLNESGQITASAYLDALNKIELKFPGASSYINKQYLSTSLGDNPYFTNDDLNYLRTKAGVGVGYGPLAQ